MEPNSKRQLLDQLTASRATLSRDVKHLRAEWDFQHKAMVAVRSNPVKWVGGAALSGFLFAKLRGRSAPRPPKISKSVSGKHAPVETEKAARKFGLVAAAIGLFRLLSPVLRPILLSYLSKAVTKYATR